MSQHAIDPEAIRRRAYARWQERGCPAGSAELDWLEAERELSRAREITTQPASGGKLDGLPAKRRPRSIVTRSASGPAAQLLVALVPTARGAARHA